MSEDVVRSLLERADLLVLPSVVARDGQMEGLPVVLMEALASGVPVVAPNAGGPVDVVADGASGLLYRPGDGGDFAAAVDRLVSDATLRATMGATAVRAVQERSWFAINEQLLEHYRAVIGPQASEGPSYRAA